MHLLRLLRLRCPHCGKGRVLRGRSVLEACTACGFQYRRSDQNYFTAAIVVNYFICGAIFALSFLATLLITWPNVPWDVLTYAFPIAMVGIVVLLHPIAKVVWLTIDVIVRPVSPDELGRQ